ncbi:hypothetical protein [Leptospira borgpetersenii]|uniref:Uncharacterized protein n=2 Tax=Leptospira borgpetersenii serovar Hardjo-bovis TaxID=338217 RepID=Q04W24_LEPBJ|nr:hypothetical protein [Leptospira borgpetersenii]ABJ74896.1 Hypothetical protein LBJ_0154 [Leptospira borgpetersenii serovar Hardjo-bovis str. JB197]ABJ80247.1 Hypothetical protein LBL_2929 [Leptospira borgpetersenii serovar Hardjo-bovis str. L550]AMX59715.1 hypothetical protein LBK6_15730 [Leptospira borgpetersenii serovar Hardjo]AMX62943.1 hypothetical protein LBK9_15645 [Leptospira borgpetersenii serovar Hardjo]AMX66186.1 hypothetical protein LBK30_15645 [Leptospira borgpetersenii serovar
MNSEKIKRFIVNREIVHEGKFWKRGRRLSQRLKQIIIESQLNLKDIEFKYSQNSREDHLEHTTSLYREHLADVIKGTRNTLRYIKAIEEAWKLPIETIRSIYREDKEAERKLEKLDPDSLQNFINWYREILRSKKEIPNNTQI